MVNSYPVGNFKIDIDRCWNAEVVESTTADEHLFFLIGDYMTEENGVPFNNSVIMSYGDSREELLVWADINNVRMKGKD